MSENNNYQDKMKNESEIASIAISDYQLNTIKVDTPSMYPYDPHIKYQNSGFYKNSDNTIIEINSELLNITRPLSNDPSKKWAPGKFKDIEDVPLKDGLFQTKHTLLDEPTMELRGKVKNRWIELQQDPQENALEPFNRTGQNTYLTLIDNYNC